MYLVTIDSIVRSALISQGLTIHHYYQFFHYAQKCFRELNLDTLKTVQVTELTIGNGNSVSLPSDFIDWVKVGIKVGQYVKPLVQLPSLMKTPNRDANGNEITYPEMWRGYYLQVNGNDRGEHLGKDYGHGNGSSADSFTFVPGRNELRFDISYPKGNKILLEYIGYGTNANTTTSITMYAQDTVENYIIWKYKCSLRNSPVATQQMAMQEYYNSLRILRGRLNAVTVQDIIRISRNNYKASIKN